jgi:flavin reductase (DIM6/NTAB) family NADH-FMN oxidoreductase RutF
MAGGAPVLAEDIVAHAECALVQSVEAGDHFVLIGHIEAGSCNGGSPLMYLRRMYAGWPNLEPAPRGEDIHG